MKSELISPKKLILDQVFSQIDYIYFVFSINIGAVEHYWHNLKMMKAKHLLLAFLSHDETNTIKMLLSYAKYQVYDTTTTLQSYILKLISTKVEDKIFKKTIFWIFQAKFVALHC